MADRRPAAADDAPLLSGRYRLLARIGTGASARVFEALDTSLGRHVAVKVLHPALAADGPFRRRFETEARHAAALSHPNLLAIYDWDDGNPVYIVTELLSGGSLRQVLDAGDRLSPSQALLVGLEAAQGLAHAHAEGFVHRDIKPANLMFASSGRLSIADFGIARAVAEASWTEPSGALIGTARYAAPEQALGRGVDGRADVYSLALTLIEAVTGDVPLIGDHPLATMVLRQDCDVVAPDELGPLAPVLSRAAKADPEQRLTAVELIAELEAAATQLQRPQPLPLPGLAPIGELDLDEIDLRPATTTDADASQADTNQLINGPPDPTAPMPQPLLASGPETEADSDRTRWPWLVAAILIALLGAAGVAFGLGAADDFLPESEPEIVTYPVGTLVGRDIDEVRREIESNTWTLETSSTRSDGSVPGEILTQSPAPGVQLEEFGVVVVVVSEGPLLHAMPELSGLTQAEAELALDAESLTLGQIERTFDEEVPDGLVLRASVPTGTEVETGSVVNLVISEGPEPRIVPDLSQRSRADAEAVLTELGLVPVFVDDFSRTVAEGLVIGTEPAPTATVEKGGEIAVVISKGLPFVTVPDVVGMSAASAADALASAGLVVTDTNGPPNKEVLATDPEAGASVRLGSGVVIFTRR